MDVSSEGCYCTVFQRALGVLAGVPSRSPSWYGYPFLLIFVVVFFFFVHFLCVDFPSFTFVYQISELREFMFDGMLRCDHTDPDSGEGPFVTHCGTTRERIPRMRLSSSKYFKLSNLVHAPAPDEGNPPFVPYVPPPRAVVRGKMNERDALGDLGVDETNLDDEVSHDGKVSVRGRVVCSSGSECYGGEEGGAVGDIAESAVRAHDGVDVEDAGASVDVEDVVPQARQASSEAETSGAIPRGRDPVRVSNVYVGDGVISEFSRPLVRGRSGDDQAESRSVRRRVGVPEEGVAVFATNINTTRVLERDTDVPQVIPSTSAASAALVAHVPVLAPPPVPECRPSSST